MINLNDQDDIKQFCAFVTASEGEQATTKFLARLDQLRSEGQTKVSERDVLDEVLDALDAEIEFDESELCVRASLTGGKVSGADG